MTTSLSATDLAEAFPRGHFTVDELLINGFVFENSYLSGSQRVELELRANTGRLKRGHVIRPGTDKACVVWWVPGRCPLPKELGLVDLVE
jgi:hypothetical protein